MVGFGVRVALVAGVGLSGCAGSSPFSDAEPRANPTATLMSKDFTVAGPRGFCVDESATRETAGSAFVMMGSCAAISGNRRDAKPKVPALLTASVAPANAALDADGLDRLANFFASDDGRTALARDDTGGDVVVLDLERGEDLVLVHARDGARMGDTAGDYWRGIFTTAGQLVTITVSGFRSTPLDKATGSALANDFANAIRRANEADPGESAGGLASFFNRLL